MFPFFSPIGLGNAALPLLLGLLAIQPLYGGESADQESSPARMNCGAQIECVTPDGNVAQVSRVSASDPDAAALIMEDDTVTCLLQEGDTNFVIELPRTATLDRFTFLNENANAQGELKIAVSNRRLPANSPEWSEVDGIIPFAHKRLFGVSLLGIETKFVRLSFHVEKKGRIAARAAYGAYLPDNSGQRSASAARGSTNFHISGLEEALNSKFAALHAHDPEVLLISQSVAPLSQLPRD